MYTADIRIVGAILLAIQCSAVQRGSLLALTTHNVGSYQPPATPAAAAHAGAQTHGMELTMTVLHVISALPRRRFSSRMQQLMLLQQLQHSSSSMY